VRWTVGTLVALLAPFLLEWACMSRFYDHDAVGAIVGMVLGVAGIGIWPVSSMVRLVCAILYVPLMGFCMFIVGASMACGYYQSCF